jgi:spermidine synthase
MTEAAGEERVRVAGGRISATGRWLLAAYAVSGAAALVYEVAWMRVLGDMLGSTAFASGTMLAAFMTGLGIGSILGGKRAARSAHPLRDSSRAELGVALASVVALALLTYLPPVFFDLLATARASALGFLSLQFAVCFAVMLLPTIAMGLTFPLIMEAVAKRSRFGRWAGLLYTTNTAGAIVGSLAAGFALIPLVGVKGALVVAAALSVVAAAVLGWLASRAEDVPRPWRSPDPIVAAVAIVGVLLLPRTPSFLLGVSALGRFESSAAYARAVGSAKILYDNEGVYSRVSVLEYPDGTRTLRNGALTEGSNGQPDKLTPELLGALPMASAQATNTALVVGLGTGFTPAELLDLGARRVTTVEINPGVVPASRFFAGKQLQAEPRWNLVIDDARAHILTDPTTYDVITSEPSWPISASVAPLFTREFMAAARTRLAPGGVFCQWLPAYLLTPADIKMMYKTMRQVYPRVDVWAVSQPGMEEGELILVGFTNRGPGTQEEIGFKALQLTDSLGLTPASFHPYSGSADLEPAMNDASIPINTDDHSLLEYRVIWNLLAAAAPRSGVTGP